MLREQPASNTTKTDELIIIFKYPECGENVLLSVHISDDLPSGRRYKVNYTRSVLQTEGCFSPQSLDWCESVCWEPPINRLTASITLPQPASRVQSDLHDPAQWTTRNTLTRVLQSLLLSAYISGINRLVHTGFYSDCLRYQMLRTQSFRDKTTRGRCSHQSPPNCLSLFPGEVKSYRCLKFLTNLQKLSTISCNISKPFSCPVAARLRTFKS